MSKPPRPQTRVSPYEPASLAREGFIIQIAMILLGLALLTPIGLMVLPLLLLAWGIGWILWRVLKRFPMHPIHITGRSHVAGAPGYDRAWSFNHEPISVVTMARTATNR